MDLPPAVAYVIAFYMMFSVCGDNASSSMSAVVGGGVRTMKEAIVMIAVFGTIGALLEGWRVEHTLGRGLILGELPAYASLAVVLATALWGSGLLLGFIPVASAYAVVGAMVGVSFFVGLPLNWLQLGLIAVGWLITPFMAAGVALFLNWVVVPMMRLRMRTPLRVYRLFSVLLTTGGCFTAYTMGANRLGFATGPLSTLSGINTRLLFAVSILGMALGPMVVGRKFINALGRDITELDAGQGFSIDLGSSVAVYALNLFGLPASFDTADFGAVLGAGASKGIRTLRRRKIKRILVTWPLSLVLSGITAYGLAYVLKNLVVL